MMGASPHVRGSQIGRHWSQTLPPHALATQGPKLIMCFIVLYGPPMLRSGVDPVAMASPEQLPFVGAVEDLTSCLVTKYTLRGLYVVGSGSRVFDSYPGGCFIPA